MIDLATEIESRKIAEGICKRLRKIKGPSGVFHLHGPAFAVHTVGSAEYRRRLFHEDGTHIGDYRFDAPVEYLIEDIAEVMGGQG